MFWRAAVMLYCIPAIVEEHSVRCTWTLLMPVKMYSGTAPSSSAMIGKCFWNIMEFHTRLRRECSVRQSPSRIDGCLLTQQATLFLYSKDH